MFANAVNKVFQSNRHGNTKHHGNTKVRQCNKKHFNTYFDTINVRKSKWTLPEGQFTSVDFLVQKCRYDIKKLKFNRFTKCSNLSTEEWAALQNRNKRKDIVIKPADKGGAVVVWRSDLYQQEAFRQLSDKSFYAKVDKDLTLTNQKLVKKTIQDLISPLISFKRNKNISDFLVRSTLKSDESPGTFNCTRKRCKTCPFIHNTDKVRIKITDRFTCISVNVIYCIKCTAYKKIYIGETGRRIGDRFREHLRDVECNDKDASKPVARHFYLPNHSTQNMTICAAFPCIRATRKAVKT